MNKALDFLLKCTLLLPPLAAVVAVFYRSPVIAEPERWLPVFVAFFWAIVLAAFLDTYADPADKR